MLHQQTISPEIEIPDFTQIDVRDFSFLAKRKTIDGRYQNYPKGSKAYYDFWEEVDNYCINGYTVGGIRITGYHFWFLNFHPIMVPNPDQESEERKIQAFPNFWVQHYHFFHALEKAEKAGKHIVILKPRGTGFSEIMSSMGARDYTLFRGSKSFYFAAVEDFLNEDGVITKVWDNLEFCNTETEDAYKHLRQKKDKDLHKRASFMRGNDEHGYKSEIIGRVIDKPRKVRGARTGSRGKVYFEEGGSFPNLLAAVSATRPLVEQGGYATGQIIVWGTGGEDGPGIEGLDALFNNPDANNFYVLSNIWDEERYGQDCGYFFPAYALTDKFLDQHGYCDEDAAKKYHDLERKKARQLSSAHEDHRAAEYPYTPGEALIRLADNDFPVMEARRQLIRVKSDEAIKYYIKNGNMSRNKEGKPEFVLDSNVLPITDYPWRDAKKAGCISIVESPFKDKQNRIPIGQYIVCVDPYYADETKQDRGASLGVAIVYKYDTGATNTIEDTIVAWYIGRPSTTTQFIKQVFLLAEYYNATIQSEIAGGGKALFDYARNNRLLHMLETEPDSMSHSEKGPKVTKNYFMSISGDNKRQGLIYLADWVRRDRYLTVDPNTDETVTVTNMHKIYSSFFLEEMIKYVDDRGNYDFISAMIVLMFMIKERGEILKAKARPTSDVFSRPWFTDQPHNDRDEFKLSISEAGMSE